MTPPSLHESENPPAPESLLEVSRASVPPNAPPRDRAAEIRDIWSLTWPLVVGQVMANIVPLIDVLLVLLIFFMSITTDQIMNVDRSIKLPVAPDAKKRKSDLENEVVVNVDWDTATAKAIVRFGAVPCEPLDQLVEFVRPMKEKNKNLKLILRGDGDTLLEHFTRTRAIRRGIVQIGQDAPTPDFGRPHPALEHAPVPRPYASDNE